MSDLNIYQRINKIREAVAYIQKDAKVQGYKAITHDMVTSEVRPHMIEHGVVNELHEVDSEFRDTGKTTKNGIPITVYIGKYHIEFVNVDDPKDRAEVSIGAMAEDQNDKGPGKAASYAMKTALLKQFAIETGESDESRQDQKPEYITADQIIEFEDIIKEKKLFSDSQKKAKFFEFAKASSIEKILASDYTRVKIALLEK